MINILRVPPTINRRAAALLGATRLGASMQTPAPALQEYPGMSQHKNEARLLSRRSLLKSLGMAPFLLQAAPLHGALHRSSFLLGSLGVPSTGNKPFAFADVRLIPHYPTQSPLEDVLRLVTPGSDEYVTEKYAYEIGAVLGKWSMALRAAPADTSSLARSFELGITGCSFVPTMETKVRSGQGIDCYRRQFGAKPVVGRDLFLHEFRAWLGPGQVETAEFEMTSLDRIEGAALAVRADIRYDLVTRRAGERREERVGYWHTEWSGDGAGGWQARRWEASQETVSILQGRGFVDVTSHALGQVESYRGQMLRGSDYWRTVLDSACGIDVYGNNGVAAGDFDNDGFDDLYVCQPSGLPNRLYRNRGDGTLEDVTDRAGVGVLDGTACALFADFANRGRQDLLVVCGSGPLLFLNQGDGTFTLKKDAFHFASPPQGTFTHAAIADYDGDGRLDIYFCLYSYYLGLDQYHYPVPYFDARNGPANYLLHNEGDGTFSDKTKAAGLDAENDRYSFACAWGNSASGLPPDLFVANDFGRGNLYRNHGDGTFTAVSNEAHVADAGAGMSAAWSDYDNDGKQDIYAANMWSAAGQRVSSQTQFQEQAPEAIRAFYRRHAQGNSLYRNQANGGFTNVSRQAGVEMGRWSWCSDFWDFDHDGYPDLYVTNGYISAEQRADLGSFFWRQVVGRSPNDATPSVAYEHGWNALNELIRSDRTWNGYERNVLYANNHDGTFSEVSGPAGLDFAEDGRSFALADLDHDGRLEVVLKNRNAPQLRILHNAMSQLGSSMAFRLRGVKSNRDAIGTAVTVEIGDLRQTKSLQAGSGFLAQHGKEVFFGVGQAGASAHVTVHWPSGLTQTFTGVPVNHRISMEEGRATFDATPFAASPPAWAQAATPPPVEPLPEQIETWLIEPLKAPEFSLPDLAGKTLELKALRGRPVLLNFWATASPVCSDQLALLQKHFAALTARQLQFVAVNVDDTRDAEAVRATATQQKLSFPVVFAGQEIAGVYNIIYRYLFDRRRDLAIPSSFLVDKDGFIVKLYQGPIDPQRLASDLTSMPGTADERLHKALPFRGAAYRNAFMRNDFTYGVALFQHGYLEQAADSFQQVVSARPNEPEAYYNLGTLSLRQNNFEKARYYLQQTLKLRPDYPEAWNNLGMISAQQGQANQALQDFQQALLLRPRYATALLNTGNVYRREKSFTQAEDFLNQALAIQPNDPETSYSLGMLYAQQGQVERASEYLQKAVALRPDYPEALNNLGVLFVRGQDYARAEEQFRKCIRIAPNFDQSYFNLARLFALRNDKQQAREVLQQLLQLQPQNANAKQAMDMLQ